MQRSNANAERALHFLSTFTAEAPERKDRSCSVFAQDLISEILLLTSATDKTVRTRACCLLAAIMQKLKIDVQDQTYEEVEEAMLGRLKDKVWFPAFYTMVSTRKALRNFYHPDLQILLIYKQTIPIFL